MRNIIAPRSLSPPVAAAPKIPSSRAKSRASEVDIGDDGTIDQRTVFSYDANGDLASSETVDSTSAVLRSVTIARDARGNAIEAILDQPAQELKVTNTASFDEVDRMLTSGVAIELTGEVFSTSDFSFRYECP